MGLATKPVFVSKHARMSVPKIEKKAKAPTKKAKSKRPKTKSPPKEEEGESWTCTNVACGFVQRPTRRTREEHAQCAQCACVRGDVLHRERSAGNNSVLQKREPRKSHDTPTLPTDTPLLRVSDCCIALKSFHPSLPLTPHAGVEHLLTSRPLQATYPFR